MRACLYTVLFLGLTSIMGCRQEMFDQPRVEPYSKSDFFEDRQSMRPLPEGVVPWGEVESERVRLGLEGEYLATKMPFSVDLALLERGRERYDIYCAVCHGYTGKGDGMIVQRGFPEPPSFHTVRLKRAPVGHFVNVIAEGYGAMYSYAARVKPRERWAIAAYIRALQFSRDVPLADIPAGERKKLEGMP